VLFFLEPIGPIEDVEIISSNTTFAIVEFHAPLPITGPINYVINAVSRSGVVIVNKILPIIC